MIGAVGDRPLDSKHRPRGSETLLWPSAASEIRVCEPLFFEVDRTSGMRAKRFNVTATKPKRALALRMDAGIVG